MLLDREFNGRSRRVGDILVGSRSLGAGCRKNVGAILFVVDIRLLLVCISKAQHLQARSELECSSWEPRTEIFMVVLKRSQGFRRLCSDDQFCV